MEPRIQYARTSDGVNIAYWTLGDGTPFVHMPWFRMSHVQLEWQIPEIRRWYEALSDKTQLVRYDARGIGLSQRDVADHSVDALVRDVEAVVDRLEIERFALFGLVHTGPVAITYAARHPERVSKLVLWCTYARSADYSQSSEIQATRDVIDKNWEMYTNTLAHVRLGWSEGEPARRFAAVMRESMSPEALHASIDAFRDLDVTDLLPQVKCPVLVLHRRQTSWLPVDVAKDLAARLPDARLSLLEGESGAPYLGDSDGVLDTISDFLDLDSARGARPRASRLRHRDHPLRRRRRLDGNHGAPRRRRRSAPKPATSTPPMRTAIRRARRNPHRRQAPRRRRPRPLHLARARPSRPRSPAPKRAPTPPSPSTSASMPATSSAKTATSTAAPSTSPRASAGSRRRARCSSRRLCAPSRARPPACASRTAASRR